MTTGSSTRSAPNAWDGIDLSGLPPQLADALSGLMADTDAICATSGDGGVDGRQAEVVAASSRGP